MNKFRVHLEHDKSVVVEADLYDTLPSGVLYFFNEPNNLLHSFGPQRWVWVEREASESDKDSEQSECNER